MKKNIFVKIICLMLTAVMMLGMLAACVKKNPPEEPEVPEEPITAESILSNFIKPNYEAPKNKLDKIVDLADLYGKTYTTYNTYSEDLDTYVVFRKESKDFMNNLTETYTVYNANLNKVMFTLSNTYADEYRGDNEFGDAKKPPMTLSVKVTEANNGVNFVLATYTVYTPIEDTDYIEEKDIYSYNVSHVYDLYDIHGNKIASTYSDRYSYGPIYVSTASDCDDYLIINFGKTNAIIDTETGKVAETYDGETGHTPDMYDYYGDKYNYRLNVVNGMTDMTLINRRSVVIFDKEGNEYFTYDYSDFRHALPSNAFVLKNGDVFIQQITFTESADYDFDYEGDQKCYVNTFIIDVSEKKVKEIEFNYFISSVYSVEDYVENIEEDHIAVTDNVRNVAVGVKIANRRMDKTCTVFFDNNGAVNFELIDIKLCNDTDSGILDVYSDGKILIATGSNVSTHAILNTDGTLTYLPEGAKVVDGKYVVTEKAVYDLDMKKLTDRSQSWLPSYSEEDGGSVGHQLVGYVGNYAVYNTWGFKPIYKNGEPISTEAFENVVFVKLDSNGSYNTIEDQQAVRLINDKLVILYEKSSGEYTIYNNEGHAIARFFANTPPSITNAGDNLILRYTDENGKQIIKLIVCSTSQSTVTPDKTPDDKDPAKDPEMDDDKEGGKK